MRYPENTLRWPSRAFCAQSEGSPIEEWARPQQRDALDDLPAHDPRAAALLKEIKRDHSWQTFLSNLEAPAQTKVASAFLHLSSTEKAHLHTGGEEQVRQQSIFSAHVEQLHTPFSRRSVVSPFSRDCAGPHTARAGSLPVDIHDSMFNKRLGPDSMTNAVDDWLGGSSLLQGLEVPAIPQQALDLRAEEQDGQKGLDGDLTGTGDESDGKARKLARRTSSVQVASANREKNRAAQRRFREKQRAKLEGLEDSIKDLQNFKSVAAAKQRDMQARNAALSQQIIKLQVERANMHARELRVTDLLNSLADFKAQGGASIEDALDDFALELKNFRSGSAELDIDWTMTKLLLFIDPMDFDATESSLLLALEGGCAMEDIYIRPSQLKIKLHKPSENRTEIVSYSVAELLHLPPEVFSSLYGQYAKILADRLDCPPEGLCITEFERKLASQLRGLMCCFSAIFPSQSAQHQLMRADSWQPVDDEVDTQVLDRLVASIQLSPAQVKCMQQAACSFREQQMKTQAERQQLMNHLQVPLYSASNTYPTKSAKIFRAEVMLRGNLEEDVFNVCRLVTHFVTRVLTVEQYCVLVATAYPFSLNVAGLVQRLVSQASTATPDTPPQS